MTTLFNATAEIQLPTWAEFKKYIDGTYSALQLYYSECNAGITCFCLDGTVAYTYFLFPKGTVRPGLDTAQNDADYDDFELNYKANARLA